MKTMPSLLLAALLFGAVPFALPAFADGPKKADVTTKASDDAFEKDLNRMSDLHRQMRAAKTPEERQHLLGEQLRLMHDSMILLRDDSSEFSNGSAQRGGMMMSGCMNGPRRQQHRQMMELMLNTLDDMMLAKP